MKRHKQNDVAPGLTPTQRAIKRTFDIVVALVGLGIVGWTIIPAALWARRESGGSGIFRQPRIGRNGRVFHIYKIRTMREGSEQSTTVTMTNDPRITRFGALLRHWKLDELPQLINVLRGDMSLVGPRPDVPAYLEQIRRDAPLALSVHPGITGPASIRYRCEEQLLAVVHDPQSFNDRVLFPDKLRINEAYVRNYSFLADLKYLWATVVPRRQATNLISTAAIDGQTLKAA
jgi:lipopolysaccharide/colanic/teichoic acid biosynthesis glycosyltransferase